MALQSVRGELVEPGTEPLEMLHPSTGSGRTENVKKLLGHYTSGDTLARGRMRYWRLLFVRQAPVQGRFFEAMYRIGDLS
jgi:hypothetical protein